jgi:integrase
MLSELQCRKAKPGAKPYKLADGLGLSLLVNPNGSRWWRFRYHFDGREQMLSLGTYPEIGLKAARERRDEARKQVAHGVNPSDERKAEKAEREGRPGRTFEARAQQWFEVESKKWRSGTYRQSIERVLRMDVLPVIGKQDIAEVKAYTLRAVFQKIRESGREETARRCRVLVGQIFRAAVADGLIETDPTQSLPREKRIRAKKHHAALTEPQDVARLMTAIHGYSGSPVVCAALKLSALLFQRPGEIRTMEWPQIDLKAGAWRYTVTKTMTPHIVPLPVQAVEVLKQLHPLTGRPPVAAEKHYVLPGERGRSRPLSENAVRVALRTMGFSNDEMTPHGFRAMARTLLAELGWPTDAIERQLAHKAAGPLGAAYDRAQFLTERRRMMQAWADYLDSLRLDARKVVPIASG